MKIHATVSKIATLPATSTLGNALNYPGVYEFVNAPQGLKDLKLVVIDNVTRFLVVVGNNRFSVIDSDTANRWILEHFTVFQSPEHVTLKFSNV